MKKVKIMISPFAIIPIIPLVLMFVSAHSGDLAYTCAMGFMALYLCLYMNLHDINVGLFNLLKIMVVIADMEEEENECKD